MGASESVYSTIRISIKKEDEDNPFHIMYLAARQFDGAEREDVET